MDDGIILWMTVLAAFIATVIWRVFGVLAGSRIPRGSPLLVWINCVAYAMIAGVMMQVVLHPVGLAATASLEVRLVTVGVAIAVMLWRGNLLLAAMAGLGGFILMAYGLGI